MNDEGYFDATVGRDLESPIPLTPCGCGDSRPFGHGWVRGFAIECLSCGRITGPSFCGGNISRAAWNKMMEDERE